MNSPELQRVRQIALALPEVTERLSHGTPCFYLRDKKPLCYFHEAGFHHDDSRAALWCPAQPGDQEALVATEPDRYFRPQPSAGGVFSDWIGVYLDDPSGSAGSSIDWTEVAGVVEDAYRKIAPKKLVALLDAD